MFIFDTMSANGVYFTTEVPDYCYDLGSKVKTMSNKSKICLTAHNANSSFIFWWVFILSTMVAYGV